jgi:hypothetical protein
MENYGQPGISTQVRQSRFCRRYLDDKDQPRSKKPPLTNPTILSPSFARSFSRFCRCRTARTLRSSCILFARVVAASGHRLITFYFSLRPPHSHSHCPSIAPPDLSGVQPPEICIPSTSVIGLIYSPGDSRQSRSLRLYYCTAVSRLTGAQEFLIILCLLCQSELAILISPLDKNFLIRNPFTQKRVEDIIPERKCPRPCVDNYRNNSRCSRTIRGHLYQGGLDLFWSPSLLCLRWLALYPTYDNTSRKLQPTKTKMESPPNSQWLHIQPRFPRYSSRFLQFLVCLHPLPWLFSAPWIMIWMGCSSRIGSM